MTVIKADGRSVAFDMNAVLHSVTEATAGWHNPDQLRSLVRAVTDEIFGSLAVAAVTSSTIGEAVAVELKRLNPVSHIRWALAFVGRVHNPHRDAGMSDARDFRRWLLAEYPHLEHASPVAGLSAVFDEETRTRVRFERERLKRSVRQALKGRGDDREIDRRASDIVHDVATILKSQPIVTSGQLAAEVLRHLRQVDDIAYLRYACVAKHFVTELDYEAEAFALEDERREHAISQSRARLATEPKPHD